MYDQNKKLARMANQIASFFRPYPEQEAIAGVRDHLHAFWTPGMLTDLRAYADSTKTGIDPLVLRALDGSSTGPSPLEKAVAGPSGGNALESDAG